MNITIIMANPAMTGGDRVCAIYAKKLTERGHHVNVVAPRKKLLTFKQQLKRLIKGDGWIKFAEQLQNHFDLLGVHVTYLESNRPVTGSDVPDADVVIATWWETAEWVAHFPACKGAKVYFIQHHEVHQGQPIERVKQTYLLPLYKITISNWLVQTMQNIYQDPNVSLVPNSVDSELFFATPRKKQVRPTLGFLYSKVEFKGIDTLLEVIEKVKERIPELRVVCFGGNKPSKNLLPKYFEFEYQPQQSRLREIYGQCDVWLCCSLSEGFHLPPLEAMACRCPVVSTKVGGPEDIVRQGKNGFLCEINDVKNLTDTVIRVLGSTEKEWIALSNEAYATATRYSWDDATELFEQGLIFASNRQQDAQL
ncbi:glycosyltransferase family 4 protein [Methylobacter sp. BlB1]|uniref:glycosyltransferase family 4 protein n=1 Tax=Methylobacter sp. BlB1 TaxID=2785914 RepID=UPI0018941E79|nr:glycosyltransferase family 4 protein [Methylobacter sp. BlB1]MBF6650508.1 glycosyltransferase family 4 protein [Methylobacter sp. BlB1]